MTRPFMPPADAARGCAEWPAANTTVMGDSATNARRAPRGQHARGASHPGLQWNAPLLYAVQRPTSPQPPFPSTISASRPHVALARCAVEEPGLDLHAPGNLTSGWSRRGEGQTSYRRPRGARRGLDVRFPLWGAPQGKGTRPSRAHALTRTSEPRACVASRAVVVVVAAGPEEYVWAPLAWAWAWGGRRVAGPGSAWASCGGAEELSSRAASCSVLDAGLVELRLWRRAYADAAMRGNKQSRLGQMPGRPSALRTGLRWRGVREPGVEAFAGCQRDCLDESRVGGWLYWGAHVMPPTRCRKCRTQHRTFVPANAVIHGRTCRKKGVRRTCRRDVRGRQGTPMLSPTPNFLGAKASQKCPVVLIYLLKRDFSAIARRAAQDGCNAMSPRCLFNVRVPPSAAGDVQVEPVDHACYGPVPMSERSLTGLVRECVFSPDNSITAG
ncbi:hypothetical protein C8Q79DRAFT_539712 [Trametes meyenii]|nr:hypothetical protein C8Q79DRAFT_539712 [Trametes meyenii]